jgi:hypothetical protein
MFCRAMQIEDNFLLVQIIHHIMKMDGAAEV